MVAAWQESVAVFASHLFRHTELTLEHSPDIAILIGSAGHSRAEHFQFRLLGNVVGFFVTCEAIAASAFVCVSDVVGLVSGLGLIDGV